ncbi:ferrochelatase [Paenibacillus dendritiformis]|uniref:ferrochelatase n=1 Tax=Paenibacillus dendritiformis TaxID=130049 RepID=UPI00143D62C0|nr:ferrochelatase [Paenibacillus dendritiformis]NKI24003.1 ferrochelatase [Paenibacillus dendritiformis]NRF99688.1 ferrochelatase [Paenibacillus dendritiformis]
MIEMDRGRQAESPQPAGAGATAAATAAPDAGKPAQAVLLAAYGACRSIDDVPQLYEHIMRGRCSPGALAQGVSRYRQTGACDPLYAVTARQAEAISMRLGQLCGAPIPVYTGYKHSPSFISEAVRQAAADGISRLALLHLSPFGAGTGMYMHEAARAADGAEPPVRLTAVANWQEHPAFIRLLARRLSDASRWLPAASLPSARVIFTVHSKPGLPSAHTAFIAQYGRLARLIAEEAEIGRWDIAYRSGLPAPQRWLGPDVKDVIRQAAGHGCQAVVLCELTSLTDNVEVYHDLGEDAKRLAEACGMQFVRTEPVNDAWDFIEFISGIVSRHLLAGQYSA